MFHRPHTVEKQTNIPAPSRDGPEPDGGNARELAIKSTHIRQPYSHYKENYHGH